jgi:hypothetical protein
MFNSLSRKAVLAYRWMAARTLIFFLPVKGVEH